MSDAVLTERTRIQAEVEGRTLVDALADTVGQYGDEPAYSDKHHVPEGESWRTLTWSETRERALDMAAALIEIGVATGDTVAIMANNRVEHFLADMGAVHAAATPMSIYNTLSPEQVAYIASQARPSVVFVETADHRARWGKALDEVDSILRVVMIDEEWEALVAAGAAYRAANPGAVEARA
ncbi:AMP-binding protein, partial [Nocardioides hankookensis]